MSEEKARRLNEAPLNLRMLIERANLLPDWIELPYFADLSFEKKHAALYEALEKLTEQAKQLVQDSKRRRNKPELDITEIERRVKEFKFYILGKLDLKANYNLQAGTPNFEESNFGKLLFEAVQRYEDFNLLRFNLKSFVGIKDKFLRLNAKLSVYRTVYFEVDQKGKLRFQIDELLDALDGVEIDRLSQCRICKRIFWIGRKGMICCSHKCGNVLNNRRARENYKADPTGYKSRKIKEEKRRE